MKLNEHMGSDDISAGAMKSSGQMGQKLGVTSRTVLNWLYRGKIPAAYRVGSVIRFCEAAVMAAVENETKKAAKGGSGDSAPQAGEPSGASHAVKCDNIPNPLPDKNCGCSSLSATGMVDDDAKVHDWLVREDQRPVDAGVEQGVPKDDKMPPNGTGDETMSVGPNKG